MSASSLEPDLAAEPAGTRKLVAIVHADIAGYSRHIGRDDTGTLDRVRLLRRDLIDPELRKQGGRVVNTAGDALLIEFASITEVAERIRRKPHDFTYWLRHYFDSHLREIRRLAASATQAPQRR